MDKKHYSYTLEQLQKSSESGSLFKKRALINVMKPGLKLVSGKYIDHSAVNTKVEISEDNIPSRQRSTLVIKEEKYEELQVSDEDFASENADLDSQNTIINKG
jgi:hypothetical protein